MNQTNQAAMTPTQILFSPLRKCYDWMLGWSDHPKGEWALYFLAMIEAVFFPIPVDPILIAMGAGKPKKALRYAALTTVFSVLGACGGYYIGSQLWNTFQGFFLSHIFSQEVFDIVMGKFRENALLSIFVAGFTPLPYKVFAIAGGVANLPLATFIFGSLVGRGARFLLLGSLLYKFGPSVRSKIEAHFEKVTIGATLLIVLFFVVYKLLL